MGRKTDLSVGDIIKPLKSSGTIAAWNSRQGGLITYLVFSSDGWRAVTDQNFDPDRSNKKYAVCFIMPKQGITIPKPDGPNYQIEIKSIGPRYVKGLFFYSEDKKDEDDDDEDKVYLIKKTFL